MLSIAAGVAGFGLGGAGAGSSALGPTTAASAWAIRITIPGQTAIGTSIVSDSGTSSGGVFNYPADGSLVSAATTTATAATSAQRFAVAKAESDVTGLSLFGGEITADGVTARASAGTGFSGAGGNQLGSTVTNLVALGQPVTGTSIAVGRLGELDARHADRRPLRPGGDEGLPGPGRRARHPPHRGPRRAAGRDRDPDRLRPGRRADPAACAEGDDDGHDADLDRHRPRPSRAAAEDASGERCQRRRCACIRRSGRPATTTSPSSGCRPTSTPSARRAPTRPTTTATTSSGRSASPLVAVADGTVFALGYDKTGGNQLWLLDAAGNAVLLRAPLGLLDRRSERARTYAPAR